MKASGGRFFYELIFWSVVITLVYVNRGLYRTLETQLEPVLQAYTTVALFLMGVALFLLIAYLREAIANTAIYIYERFSGNNSGSLEKGNAPKNIIRTARRLERKRNYEGAGEAYESLELWRDAAMVYQRGNCFGRAAVAWHHAGVAGKAIEFYEKDGKFEAAGDLCLAEGLQDRATRNYRIAGEKCLDENQFAAAAEFFEKAHDYGQAGNVFESAHKPDRALNCYEKAGNIAKIRELLEKIHPSDYLRRGPDFTRVVQRSAEALASAGFGGEAAKILEDCHDLIRAAEIYSSNKMWDKSAELYLKAGRPEMTAAVVRNIEDKQVAADVRARVAASSSDWQTAGENYETAGKNNQAIDAYKKARDFESAARLYEAMGRFIMAGEMYSSGKNLVAAANAYAKAYDWRNAAECFEQVGDLSQAIEAYANASNYVKAGMLSIRVSDYARAIEYLQRVPTGSPDFSTATAFLAAAFYYQCHYDMAHDLFSRVMDSLPLSRETLPVFYAYARSLEAENPKKSLGLFRQVIGLDVQFSDASERAQRLETIVTSMTTTGHGTNVSTNPSNQPKIIQSQPIRDSTPYTTPLPGSISSFPTSVPPNDTSAGFRTPSLTVSRQKTDATLSGSRFSIIEGRYELQDVIQQSGRVTDYKGIDTTSGRKVFIRTFPRPDQLSAFDQTMEGLAKAARLSHPNISSIIRYGESGGLVYVISDMIEGQDLRQWIRSKGPLSIRDMRIFAGQLLTALDYAHSQNVYHLNLRPETIIINTGNGEKLSLTGFGVPKRIGSNTESVYLTMPDSDPQYMAPEQILGGELDTRTDIYAFGLLLFFVLTGRTPFEVKRVQDTQEIARMQVQISLARPSTIRATLPSSVDEVFLKCVHKSPASRFNSISELSSVISDVQTGTVI